ncbi:hypothetical protein [Kocuria palustris]|nr:hypothetical protein [Kocuria palustris]MBM7822795.1 hypothetical protein [Kocuria palustris]
MQIYIGLEKFANVNALPLRAEGGPRQRLSASESVASFRGSRVVVDD